MIIECLFFVMRERMKVTKLTRKKEHVNKVLFKDKITFFETFNTIYNWITKFTYLKKKKR